MNVPGRFSYCWDRSIKHSIRRVRVCRGGNANTNALIDATRLLCSAPLAAHHRTIAIRRAISPTTTDCTVQSWKHLDLDNSRHRTRRQDTYPERWQVMPGFGYRYTSGSAIMSTPITVLLGVMSVVLTLVGGSVTTMSGKCFETLVAWATGLMD